MAAASVLTPSSHYQPPPSFAASTYPPQTSGPSSTPSMISSSEPRRAAEDNKNSNSEAPTRQSLPSISEVISAARAGQYPPHHMPPQPSYPPPAPTSHPYHPAHMPPGQMPPPGYPISPRHEHYDAPRPQTHSEPSPYDHSRYEAPPRHYENWTNHEPFNLIGSHSRTIFNFAEAYGRAAQEQGGQPNAKRLPSVREVNEMLANADYIKRSLEQVREVAKGYEESHDANKVKKRRGRAAPPGRCHSCNRIDTPEWRRGPDGARTLCNACGLHYAKLERKRQLEARSLRPKSERESSGDGN
ncbi:hypothetical protein PWT90_09542 [Aphanocladium album]|nr:hypothetical protein PWT90_09542 [Aphanocladium album]